MELQAASRNCSDMSDLKVATSQQSSKRQSHQSFRYKEMNCANSLNEHGSIVFLPYSGFQMRIMPAFV